MNAPKSLTEHVADIKRLMNSPQPKSKAGWTRWEKRLENALTRLCVRLTEKQG